MGNNWRERGLVKCSMCDKTFPKSMLYCPTDKKKLRRRPRWHGTKHRFVNTNMGERKSVEDMDSVPLVVLKVKHR